MLLPFKRVLLWFYLEGKTTDEIKKQLDEISLPVLEKADFEGFENDAKELPLPPSLRRRLIKKTYDEQDYLILNKHGLGEIYLRHTSYWEKNPALQTYWQQVREILHNPVMRIAIDVAILSKYSYDDLIQIIAHTFHEKFEQESIALYVHYFFDHKSLCKSDWRTYLSICSSDNYTYIRYYAALTKPKEEALFLAGLPAKTEFSDFLRNVLETASYKFQYYSRHNAPVSDAQARSWAKVGFDAGVRYKKFSASDVTDFAKTLQTEFEYIESAIDDIDPDMIASIRPSEKEVFKESIHNAPPLIQPETEV